MAIGSERREGTPDSLVGATGITPVEVQTPQLQIPNASVPDVINNTSSQMMRSLSKWSGSRIQEYANKQHEASILDGQMAYQQGKAMEDLDMGGKLFGDKWAMQGYRVMQAQTMASTMLASQQEMIRQSQYEQDPEQFRATYVNRLEQQLDGMDPQTSKMVREQMAEHMPTLVAQQTTAYMQNEEQNAFDALATQVGVLTKDPTSFDAFIANATGSGGAGGLSQDRTDKALTQGVQTAFSEGNPQAYQLLKASGALDKLPAASRETIRGAKTSYENMKRSQLDASFVTVQDGIETAILAGDYIGKSEQLTDDLTTLYADNGMEIRGQELGAAYVLASDIGDMANRTEFLTLQAAMVSGDVDKIVEGTSEIIDQHDSGAVVMNNHNATRSLDLSPELTGTLNSVLPALGLTFEVFSGGQPAANGHNDTKRVGSTRHDGGNAADGFFYKDGRKLDPQNNSADRVLVSEAVSQLSAAGLTGFGSGEDYMQTGSVHLGYGTPGVWGAEGRGVNSAGWLVTAVRTPGVGGSGAAWADNVSRYNGDIEAAALAHHTDQDTADAWVRDGKSWEGINPAAKTYVEGVMSSVNGEDLPTTQAQRLSIAQTGLESAQSLRDALLEQNTIDSERKLSNRMRFPEQQLAAGNINATQFQNLFDTRREALGLERGRTQNTYVASQITNSIKQAQVRADAAGDEDTANKLYMYEGSQANLTTLYSQGMAAATTSEEMQQLGRAFQEASIVLAQEAGVDIKQTGLNKQQSLVMTETARQSDRLAKLTVANTVADYAIRTGTAGTTTGEERRVVDQRLDQKVVDAVKAGENLLDPSQSTSVGEAQIQVWGAAGTVTLDAKRTFSAGVNGPLFVDGQPSQNALAAFSTFKSLREEGHHRAANSMFDDAARLRMEAIVSMVPGGISADAQQVGETLRHLETQVSDVREHASLQSARGVIGEVETAELASDYVNDFMDNETVSGVFENWFTPRGWRQQDELTWKQTQSALSEENVDSLTNALEDRFTALSSLNSGALPETIMGLAAEQILSETTVVGDSAIIMNQGHSITTQMFGDTDFSSTPLAEHAAISQYIAMKAVENPEAYGSLIGTTRREDRGAIYRFFTGLTGQTSALSTQEAEDVYSRNNGVRPFELHTNDGVNATISVLGTDGSTIELDATEFGLRAIGDWKMQSEMDRLERTELDEIRERGYVLR